MHKGNTTRGDRLKKTKKRGDSLSWGRAAQDERGGAGDQRELRGEQLGSDGRYICTSKSKEGEKGDAPGCLQQEGRYIDGRGKRRGIGKEKLCLYLCLCLCLHM